MVESPKVGAAYVETDTFLYGAGPTERSGRVEKAGGVRSPSHLDPALFEVITRTSDYLRYLLQASKGLVLALPFTGSGGVQTALEALLPGGSKIVIGGTGGFSRRMEDMVKRIGAKPIYVEHSSGEPLNIELIREKLIGHPDACLGFVHLETSTGVLSDADGLVSMAGELGRRVVIDAVTSAPGKEVNIDRLNARGNSTPIAVTSCGQKRFGALPGVSPFVMNEAAVEFLNKSGHETPTWSYDLQQMLKYISNRVYTFTVPTSLLLSIHEATRELAELGLEELYARQAKASQAFEASIIAAGLSFQFESRSDALKAVSVPADINMKDVIVKMRAAGFEISGSMGDLEGKFWRFGLLGLETLKIENLRKMLSSFYDILKKEGAKIEVEKGLAALKTE